MERNMDPSSLKRRLTCILAADAVGYSKMMGQDEEGTIQVLSAHRAVIDGIIAFHQGRIVSTAGDSVLAEFSSAVEALRCAVEIQEALKTRNDSLPEHRKMHFRIGVNLGDVVVKNDDLLGDGVNVAARLETMAESGGICISSSVYDQITGKLDLGFHDIGEQTLKNISRPIRVYRVSGTSLPLRLPVAAAVPPLASPSTAPGRFPWAVATVATLVVGVALAWQGGWVRFGGENDVARVPTAVEPAMAVVSAPALQVSAAPSGVSASVARPLAQPEPARTRDTTAASRPAKPVVLAQAAAMDPVAPTPAVRAVPEPKVQPQKPVPTPPAIRAGFDGVWRVTVECPRHEDGAAGYTVELQAEVKDGALRGEIGTEGNPGWLLVRGDIQADGSALFHAKGLTADPKFSVKGVRKGSPYAYQVVAQFDGGRGTGRRQELRACVLTFVRQ
jgi:class 3 adenylate cyclase